LPSTTATTTFCTSSVIALTNSSGSTVEVYEYSVYGEVSASDPNHPNRFLFTGREFDKDTGLYYYRARYYNPYIGRFLQTDPAGEGINGYAYCDNDPIGFVDPDGLKHRWYLPQEGQKMVDGGYLPPPAIVPSGWVEYPWPEKGAVKPWPESYFYWWYTHMTGDQLDLIHTAGYGSRELGPKISRWIEDFRTNTKTTAHMTWDKIASEYRKIGRIEEWLRTINGIYRRYDHITFNQPLGGGWTLRVWATITLTFFADKNKTITGSANIDYSFSLSGWFRDRWDIENGVPENYVCWEYDYGYPYAVVGYWAAWDSTYVGPPNPWRWTAMLSWREFWNW
jgi:RHS repeat-associated protein